MYGTTNDVFTSLLAPYLLFSFSRSALWVGTTSFMILVLPVVFETERLQLEQQQLQQQRQVNTKLMQMLKKNTEQHSRLFLKEALV